MIKYIEHNNYIRHLDLTGNIYYCTDVHGRFDLLEQELQKVGFCSEDHLIVGGDSIDRGHMSEQVLDYLDNDNTYLIKGNHEELYMRAFEENFQGPYTNNFLNNGGLWALSISKDEQIRIYEFFRSLPVGIKLKTDSGTFGIVHAESTDDWDLFEKFIGNENAYQEAIWSRTRYKTKYTTNVQNVDYVLVGHTPTDSGEVETLGNVHFCDVGAVYRNKLKLLCLQSAQFSI